MKSHVIISVVAILAAVAIVGSMADEDKSIALSPGVSEGTAAMMNYSQQDLREHPRPPLPRNSPGSWLDSDDYPSTTLHSGLEGRVGFSVTVDVHGEVSDCGVTRSSGVPAFDRRVCNAVSTRARFFPALDGQQEPVRGEYQSTVVWQIDRTSVPDVELRAEVSRAGEVTGCVWTGGSALPGDLLPVCVAAWRERQRVRKEAVYGQVPMTILLEDARQYMRETQAGR